MTVLSSFFPGEHDMESRCSSQGRDGEQNIPMPVSARPLCSCQTGLSAAQDGPFWDASTSDPPCQLCPCRVCEDAQQAPSDHCSEERGRCAAATSRISWPLCVVAISFKGLLKGRGKCTFQENPQFHVDSGQSMNFPTLPGGVKCIHHEKQSPTAASLEMGVQLSKDHHSQT